MSTQQRRNFISRAPRRKSFAKLHPHSTTGNRRQGTKCHFRFPCIINTSDDHRLGAASGRSQIYLLTLHLNVKYLNCMARILYVLKTVLSLWSVCVCVFEIFQMSNVAPQLLCLNVAAVVKTPECRCNAGIQKCIFQRRSNLFAARRRNLRTLPKST